MNLCKNNRASLSGALLRDDVPARPTHHRPLEKSGIVCSYMNQGHSKLVVEGIREDGSRFRPSDWIERISATLATFGPDHRLRYARGVQPKNNNKQKNQVVDNLLREEDPAAYEYVLAFAKANQFRLFFLFVCVVGGFCFLCLLWSSPG